MTHLASPPAASLSTTTASLAQQQNADAGPSIFSFGGVDYTEEELGCDEKLLTIGFVGEHSEIAWLYRLKRDLDEDNPTPIKEPLGCDAISSVNYLQDNSEFLVLDHVDLARRPPQIVADRLVDAYFNAVHPAFPLIGKSLFLNQYQSFYSKPNSESSKRWLALLNLILAIAARHLYLIDQPQPDREDHRTFFARAWRLSVGNVALLDHPDLQQVQVEGLAALYLLSVGQVNRSWKTIGIAIRSAMTMGLNLRSESESVPYFSKELRYRLWWALSMLDTILCEMTGHPLSIRETFCTTPLPVPLMEEDLSDARIMQAITDQGTQGAFLTSLLSKRNTDLPWQGIGNTTEPRATLATRNIMKPNASLFLLYAVELDQLLRKAIENLYAHKAMRQSWDEIETAISTFNSHADDWLSRLPAEFDFTTSNTTQTFTQHRANLAFRFYATKLIITQPSLRRLSLQSSEARSPAATCDNIAAICVQTACQMIDFLPEEADRVWLYSVAPWWCIVHNIMQSITVLLIELFARTHSGTPRTASITHRVKKATRWLKEMSAKDPSSQRAWLVCMDILSRHGSKFGLDLN
ncbi:hypothetical protein N7541_009505 [Penicillium brevicompactum]|uniref:Xylanolytic transcriptional activator regulatory domain-containing protein n=1 Tax=Penicillium brevicompactum TaxID=5074 RepID=A0A9W9QLQ2_PENBR|nr:hypothetical protein N7541_009505 [Penicillium brevicompactum]